MKKRKKILKKSITLLLIAAFVLTSLPPFMTLDSSTAKASSSFCSRDSLPNNARFTMKYYNNVDTSVGYGNYNPYTAFKVGNCTWYSFGRAWEILGYYPAKLVFSGDAYVWFSKNKSNYDNGKGGYPYNTDPNSPKIGAIACWSDDRKTNSGGHVAIVENITNNSDGSKTIITSESGYGNYYFKTETRNTTKKGLGSSNYTFLGYIYIGDFYEIEHIHSYNTYVYDWKAHPHYSCYQCSCGDIKENIAKPNYILSCDKCNPPHICSYDTFSYYEDTHPHYAVYKCTCGATQKHSEKSPYDECTLCPPPSATDLSVTPGTSSTETTITWNSRNVLVSSCNNCYFILRIYDSNNNLIKAAEETCSMTNLNPSVSFILPTGNYTAHLFTFKNDEYSNFSSISISFSVSQETNVLKAIPGTSTTPTTLSWLIIPGATICQPVIEDFYTGEIVESEMFKSNENNSWSVILPKGKYCAYLMTDNSNREDLKYGNDIVFTVLEGSFTLDYNSNGGYDSPASQTGSTSYIIPSTTPAKQGYVFLGWSKNSTSSFVSYVAGDCITLTSDTMLYAVWEYEIYILCGYCGKTFNTETRYEEHIEKEHVYSFSEKCPTCGDDFNNTSAYNIHVNICLPDSYSGTLSYMCSYCGEAFNNQSTFVSHTANCLQKTTALGCLKHCYYCENQFYDEHEFNNHLQSCRPVEKCSFCEKEFLRFEVENHQASCNNKNYYYDIIKTPSTSTISYGDAIILRVDAAKNPAGGYVEWTVSNGNFDFEVSADGMTCKITPSSSGDTTFTATVYDANGNAVSKDEQTMTSKAGFFDKIIAFFKKLFGLTKTYENVYKSIF